MTTIVLAGKLVEFEFMKGIDPATYDNDKYCDLCGCERDHITFWEGKNSRKSVFRACSKHNDFLNSNGNSFLTPEDSDQEAGVTA